MDRRAMLPVACAWWAVDWGLAGHGECCFACLIMRIAALTITLAIAASGVQAQTATEETHVVSPDVCDQLLREYRQGLRRIPKLETPERERMDECIRLVTSAEQKQ
jgi:hypothetical protein